MMIRIFCLAFVVVSVSCKPHGLVNKNCCPPKQFEAVFGLSGGAAQGGKPLGINGYGIMAADTTVKKQVFVQNVNLGPTVMTVKTIMDFNAKIQYVANMKSKKCTKLNLTMPYDDGCVPSSLHPVGDFVMGGEGDTLNVVTYVGKLSLTGEVMDVAFTVTKENCLPVGETVSGSDDNVGYFIVYGFFNITIGIKDPSIFNVPSFCN